MSKLNTTSKVLIKKTFNLLLFSYSYFNMSMNVFLVNNPISMVKETILLVTVSLVVLIPIFFASEELWRISESNR